MFLEIVNNFDSPTGCNKKLNRTIHSVSRTSSRRRYLSSVTKKMSIRSPVRKKIESIELVHSVSLRKRTAEKKFESSTDYEGNRVELNNSSCILNVFSSERNSMVRDEKGKKIQFAKKRWRKKGEGGRVGRWFTPVFVRHPRDSSK